MSYPEPAIYRCFLHGEVTRDSDAVVAVGHPCGRCAEIQAKWIEIDFDQVVEKLRSEPLPYFFESKDGVVSIRRRLASDARSPEAPPASASAPGRVESKSS